MVLLGDADCGLVAGALGRLNKQTGSYEDFALRCSVLTLAQMSFFVLKGFVGKLLVFAFVVVCSSKIGVWPSKGLLLDNRATIQQHLAHVWCPGGLFT